MSRLVSVRQNTKDPSRRPYQPRVLPPPLRPYQRRGSATRRNASPTVAAVPAGEVTRSLSETESDASAEHPLDIPQAAETEKRSLAEHLRVASTPLAKEPEERRPRRDRRPYSLTGPSVKVGEKRASAKHKRTTNRSVVPPLRIRQQKIF